MDKLILDYSQISVGETRRTTPNYYVVYTACPSLSDGTLLNSNQEKSDFIQNAAEQLPRKIQTGKSWSCSYCNEKKVSEGPLVLKWFQRYDVNKICTVTGNLLNDLVPNTQSFQLTIKSQQIGNIGLI